MEAERYVSGRYPNRSCEHVLLSFPAEGPEHGRHIQKSLSNKTLHVRQRRGDISRAKYTSVMSDQLGAKAGQVQLLLVCRLSESHAALMLLRRCNVVGSIVSYLLNIV